MAIKCELFFQYNPCNVHCNFVNKIIFSTCYSDVTEASWHPNSPVIRLIVQDHVQTNIKATPTGPLWGNPPVTDGFPHKGPVTRKIIPSHNVIRTMILTMPRQRILSDGCNVHCNFVNKIIFSTCYSDVTEASWHPNSPVIRLIVQDHVQTNIKATPTGPLWGNPPVTDGFPHKGPVTRKTIPSHNVIRTMILTMPRQRILSDGCLCA